METQPDANPAPGFARHPDHRIDVASARVPVRAMLHWSVGDSVNVAGTCEEPCGGLRAIAGWVAFDPDRVKDEG